MTTSDWQWNKGEKPDLPDGTIAVYVMRNGKTAMDAIERLDWRRGGDDDDILQYRAIGNVDAILSRVTLEPGYESLECVLREAYEQAAVGKGNERHARGEPFHRQPIIRLCELYGIGFALGQAAKKMEESQRMAREAAKRELLGAINYIAGAIIYLEREGA